MKLGLIGLPQVGKKTIFQLLTGSKVPETFEGKKSIPGLAGIRDNRFTEMVNMYEPKKQAPAQINIKLLPKIEENTSREIYREIADCDAICHIVRAFQDEAVYHLKGSVDPARDIDYINSELLLHDLMFIETRLERIEKNLKSKKTKSDEEEKALLATFREHLENELPLRSLEISQEDEKTIMSYPFLTRKKLLVVLNIDDSAISSAMDMELKTKFSNFDIDIVKVPAQIELEIAQLETEEEQQEFMQDVGITEPAINALSSMAMKSLGLISFFTVGKDEVRQWLIRKDSPAPEAAGAIHSDIQRGFIRAEVMKYADLITLGSEDQLKKAGKFYTMGKDYIVEDGDIINFRFNV